MTGVQTCALPISRQLHIHEPGFGFDTEGKQQAQLHDRTGRRIQLGRSGNGRNLQAVHRTDRVEMRGTGMIERKDRKIAGVIFDVDGTLLDTMPVWRNSGARFLASLGIQAERGLGEKLFSETVETGAKYIVDKYRLEMSAQDVADGIDAQVAHAYESEAGFKPGAEKLLNTLKDQNIPMTVATSTRRHLIEMAFERLGIMDC